MKFADFSRRHREQCIDDGRGWYETCFTFDGRKRPRETLRVCPEEATGLGESVTGGVDGRMGSDVRRWPETTLGHLGGLNVRSPRARVDAHARFTNDFSDDRRATHVASSEGQTRLYKKAPRGIILRWRYDKDGHHVHVQLARPTTDATSLRQQMVDANYRGVLDIATFPEGGGHDYLSRFLETNDMTFEQLSSGLRPRPGVYRVPLLTPRTTTSQYQWMPVSDDRLLLPSHGEIVRLQDGTSVVWCTLHGLRVASDKTVDAALEQPTLLNSVMPMTDREVVGAHDGGRVRWKAIASVPTSDTLRSYIVGASAPNMLSKVASSLSVSVRHSLADGGMICSVQRGGDTIATSTTSRYVTTPPVMGGVYVTDDGIRSGFPMTHTKDRTFVMEPYWKTDEHQNDADEILYVHTDRPGRAGLIGILHAILHGQASYVAAIASDPIWRAQLCGVLKLMPVAHPSVVLPEHELLIGPTDRLALAPDELHVRIKGSSKVLPLMHNHSDMVAPFYADLDALRDASHTIDDMDAILEPASDTARTECVLLRVDPETKRVNVVNDGATIFWSNTTVFSYRKRRWRNVASPITLAVDRFELLPAHIQGRGSFLVRTSNRILLLDVHASTDPRLLVLPTRPVYMSSIPPSTAHFMLRPYPSKADVQTMLDFCQSVQCRELFRACASTQQG